MHRNREYGFNAKLAPENAKNDAPKGGGGKQFPENVKKVNVVFRVLESKRARKIALREVKKRENKGSLS